MEVTKDSPLRRSACYEGLDIDKISVYFGLDITKYTEKFVPTFMKNSKLVILDPYFRLETLKMALKALIHL